MTWSQPERRLGYVEYLSLFLMGLLNPVVRTMRGSCAPPAACSGCRRSICRRPVSLGSFSEAQAVLEPALLARGVFEGLPGTSPPAAAVDRPSAPWLIQDSSLFEALPRMHWCL